MGRTRSAAIAANDGYEVIDDLTARMIVRTNRRAVSRRHSIRFLETGELAGIPEGGVHPIMIESFGLKISGDIEIVQALSLYLARNKGRGPVPGWRHP